MFSRVFSRSGGTVGGGACAIHPSTSKVLVTNDSKATVSVLYWYGNYPNLTEEVSDFFELETPGLRPGSGLCPAFPKLQSYP